MIAKKLFTMALSVMLAISLGGSVWAQSNTKSIFEVTGPKQTSADFKPAPPKLESLALFCQFLHWMNLIEFLSLRFDAAFVSTLDLGAFGSFQSSNAALLTLAHFFRRFV